MWSSCRVKGAEKPVIPQVLGLGISLVKSLPSMQETRVQSLGREDPLEEGMATQLQYSCLENPMDGADWRTAVHGVAKSRTEAMERCFIDM